MRYQIEYLDNVNNNFGNYFVQKKYSKEIIYDFERAKYKILGLDPYSKDNYVYLSTDVTRMLRLEQVNQTYGNGALVYKSIYFCNGLWHFNLHINSNLNCYMLVLVNDFSCRPPYIPNLTSKLLPPMSPLGIPSLNNTPTMTSPDSTLFVSPVEDVKYEYVKTKKTKPRYEDFDDIDDSSSDSESEKQIKKPKNTKKKNSKNTKKKNSKNTKKKNSKNTKKKNSKKPKK